MTFDKLTSVLNNGRSASRRSLVDPRRGPHRQVLVGEDLVRRATRAGVPARPPTAEKALKAAVREAAVGQPDRLIRLGKEDEAEIVFAVVRETKHAEGSVTYQQETRIILDRKAESVSSDIAGHDLGDVISTRWAEMYVPRVGEETASPTRC